MKTSPTIKLVIVPDILPSVRTKNPLQVNIETLVIVPVADIKPLSISNPLVIIKAVILVIVPEISVMTKNI